MVLGWADAPSWEVLLPRLRAAGLMGAGGALAAMQALGFDARVASALDPSQGATLAWTAGGVVFALPLRGATALEGIAGLRLREEPSLGAWIERAGDAGSARVCLLRAVPSPRMLCAADASTLRQVAPWLSQRAGSTDDAVHAWVRDGALGPLTSAATLALTAWLRDEAARARAAHGPPTQGDPEVLIDALRDAGARWGGDMASLRGVSLTVRVVEDGLRLEAEATRTSRVARAASGEGLRLEVPRRGLAWAWRGLPEDLRTTSNDLVDLVLRVMGTRTAHGPRVRADIARWSAGVGAMASGSVAWQPSSTSLALRVAMRDEAVARTTAQELQGSPWWVPREGAARADGATLRVERGTAERAEVAMQGDAFAAAVLRLGEEVREGCTAQAWRRGSRVGARVFLGAAWVRLADDERDR